VRLAWAAAFGDLAFGWYRGRDSLPQLSGEVVPLGKDDESNVDLTVHLAHPRIQMLAAELRAPLFGNVSGWVDGALIFPERTVAFVSAFRLQKLETLRVIDSAPDEDVEGVIQPADPYVTGVLGADVILFEELYLNAQWLHGFILERTAEELHDYALLALRYPSIGGKLRVRLRGGVELGDSTDELGWLANGRLGYLFADALRMELVTALQGGRSGTTLRKFRDLSEVRVELGADF
jgi:hypothetical protein